MEKGTQATSFDWRHYTTELHLCQRYYQKTYDIGTIPASATRLGMIGVSVYGAGSCIYGTMFKTSMRTAPSVIVYDGAGTIGVTSYYQAGAWTDNSGNARAVNPSENGFNYNYGYSSNPWTTGQPVNFHYVASAELVLQN